MTARVSAFLAAACLAAALTGCGASAKAYDIAPIFPLTTDKCARYGGEQKGEGFAATCMVTKEQCEKAAADWKESMDSGGIDDAIRFTCD